MDEPFFPRLTSTAENLRNELLSSGSEKDADQSIIIVTNNDYAGSLICAGRIQAWCALDFSIDLRTRAIAIPRLL